MRTSITITAVVIGLLSGHVLADITRITKCDELAASPYDSKRLTKGVPSNSIDYKNAVPACHEALRKNPDSLRLMYQYGRALIIAKDYENAFKWLNQAALLGYASAQTGLGYLYASGNGTSVDYGEAVKLFRLAASQGNLVAQHNLGYMYENGFGVEKDTGKAYHLYYKAAGRRYPESQYAIGYYNQHGIVVNKNLHEAVRLFKLAADQGFVRAMESLGDIYYSDGNYETAKHWYEMAALKDSIGAQRMLGKLYAQGQGVQQGLKEAHSWWRVAADRGDAESQSFVATNYYYGKGVPQSYSNAFMWYKKAAAQDSASAIYSLGVMYLYGQGVEKNPQYAEALFKNIADKESKYGNKAREALAYLEKQPRETDNSGSNTAGILLGGAAIAIMAAILLGDDSDSDESDMYEEEPERNTVIPIDTYDPCSNPWYAEDNPFC